MFIILCIYHPNKERAADVYAAAIVGASEFARATRELTSKGLLSDGILHQLTHGRNEDRIKFIESLDLKAGKQR